MKYLSILLLTILIACNNDIELNQNLPACINAIVNDSVISSNLVTILSQIVDDEQVYLMNTNEVFVDGSEFIISAACDTLCFYCGECIEPECIKDYPSDKWTIIWEK